MSNARFFRTAFTCMFTVLAGISISSAAASDKDLVWEIIDASGMIEAMEVGASDGLKAAIAPVAQQLEPLGDCGVPVIEALEADIAALLATLTDKVLLEPTVQLYAENFSVDELRAILEFYKSPVGVKIKELAPEFATAGTEGSTKALMDVMPSFQTRMQETIVKEGAKAQQCMAGSN